MRRVCLPWLGLILAAAISGPTLASMYKCTDSHGVVSYQQLPCPGRPVDESVLEIKEQPKLGTGTPEDSIPKPNEPAPPHPMQADPSPAELPPADNGSEFVDCTTPTGQTIRVPADIGCRPERAAAGPNAGHGGQRPGPGSGGPLRRGRVMAGQRGPATSVDEGASVGTHSDPEQACAQARAEGERRRRENMSLSFDERSRLDARVRELCGQ